MRWTVHGERSLYDSACSPPHVLVRTGQLTDGLSLTALSLWFAFPGAPRAPACGP